MRENSLSTLIVYICNFRHTVQVTLEQSDGISLFTKGHVGE